MKYLLALTNLDYVPSCPGDNIKTVYKLDSKKHELLAVKDIDIQKQINSYFDETNYKNIIEKLHTSQIEEAISAYYPQNMAVLYGDATVYSDNYLDNFNLSKEVIQYHNYLEQQKIELSKKEKPAPPALEKQAPPALEKNEESKVIVNE